PHVLVRPGQHLACDLRHRGVLCNPGATACIGETEMNPDPAGAVLGQRLIDLVVGDCLCGAVGFEAVDPDNPGGGVGVGQIGCGGHWGTSSRCCLREWSRC